MTTEQQRGSSAATILPSNQRSSQSVTSTPQSFGSLSGPASALEASATAISQLSPTMPSRQFSSKQVASKFTSPILANTVQQRKALLGPAVNVSRVHADTVLPSTALSDDVPPDLSNVVDLENEGDDPRSRRLQDLAARYGGIDELERRLDSSLRPENLLVDNMSTSPPDYPVIIEQRSSSVAQQDSPRKRSLGGVTSYNKRARTSPQLLHQPMRLSEQNRHDMASYANSESPTRQLLALEGPSLRQYIPVLENFVTSNGGATGLQGSIELPRIRLLKDACMTEDYSYLVLHQLYCLHSVAPETVLRLPGLSQEHLQAFGTLAQLLLHNSLLSEAGRMWFSSFPAPIDNLLRYSVLYQTAYGEARDCLMKLVRHWHPFQARCKQRMYPPLVDELVRDLSLGSCVFQRVIFTAVHRSIWGQEQSHWFLKGEELFKQNQAEYQHRRSRMNTANPPTITEMRDANDRLVKEYHAFRLEHLHEIRVRSLNSHTAPSTVIATPATSTPMHQDSFPSPRAYSGALSTAAVDTFQDRSQRTQIHPPAAVLPSNFPPPQRSRPDLNLNTTTSQPLQSLGSPHGIVSPGTPSSTIPLGRLSSQKRHTLTERLRIRQQQSGQTNHNRLASASASVSLSVSPLQSPWNNSVQQGLESLPPGAPGFERAEQQQYVHGGGYRGRHVPPLNSRVVQLGPQLFIPSVNNVVVLNPHSNPTISALHQAHVRSPTLKTAGNHTRNPTSSRLYQFIVRFAFEPLILEPGLLNNVWQFSVTRSELDKVAPDRPGVYGAPPTRDVHPGSEMYRLRCVKMPPAGSHINESWWVVADNSWPKVLVAEFNKANLELRRKQHHGKDLPIDITPHIKEGINEVRIGLLRPSKEDASVRYAVAIEVINVADHKHAMDSATPVPAHEIFGPIQASLASSHGDDDVKIVNNDISIGLVDPFTASIFESPARGRGCLHRECFDHETFLQTRKSKHPGWPCMVDEWKCPICGVDARPQSLIVDCFLAEVREELEKQKLLDTRTIIIKEDGTWRPKVESGEESKDGVSKHGLGQASAAIAHGGGVLLTPRKESVVIELDDD